jgi:hypothetical protein
MKRQEAVAIQRLTPLLLFVGILPVLVWGAQGKPDFTIQNNVMVAMRDGVKLQADVWRPKDEGKFPTLVYRTPYNRNRSPDGDTLFRKAVERGYAVVMQDVRGRYGSEGQFNPYFQEGKDGYDTIEWAAAQPWSDGNVGTFGLSYPGAVQWLAAIENPPHLKGMVPAMTFSTPRNFVYSGGVFDGSWVAWIWGNIAPDRRVRMKLPGPQTGREARAARAESLEKIRRTLPLSAMTELREVSPWYYEWLKHEPTDPYWDAIDLRDKYQRTSAAVINFSGWYDEAYGPEGAATNFVGLMNARKKWPDPKVKLILGPWVHGGQDETKAGERDFGPAAKYEYDEMILRWMDKYVRGMDNGVDKEPRVRAFVMEDKKWHDANTWPLPGTKSVALYFAGATGSRKTAALEWTKPKVAGPQSSVFDSDPANPVTDPFPAYTGGHDYSEMGKRSDVLVFDTEPLQEDLTIVGAAAATIHLSCDSPDTDLWVKLMDVGPDGKAINLMSPGLDVLRASYRNEKKRNLLQPRNTYKLEYKYLMTGNMFKQGHRIRVQISATFFPHFSRNLHTGKLETTESGETRKASIRIHHDAKHPSVIGLPVVSQRN